LEKLLDEKFKNVKSRVTLKDMNKSNIDMSEYNRMMMSREFLDQIPTEIFMIIQMDSIICGGRGDILKEFMSYDYVGAPWKADNTVGNGGFSLRRKSKMLEIVDTCYNKDMNEDIFFSQGCDGVKPNKPSFEQAKRFSIETVYNDTSFGVHKAWHHLPEHGMNLSKQCIGYDELRALQGQED